MKTLSVRRGRRSMILTSLVLAVAASALCQTALAQQRGGRRATPGWHGDIARFHEHDWGVWRGGHWAHQRYGGRMGWWWVVGGIWYFYPSPVYPYPNPWEPSPAIVVTPSSAIPPAPPTAYWYYCDASKTYYPYAATCPGGWVQVPATPDAASGSPMPVK